MFFTVASKIFRAASSDFGMSGFTCSCVPNDSVDQKFSIRLRSSSKFTTAVAREPTFSPPTDMPSTFPTILQPNGILKPYGPVTLSGGLLTLSGRWASTMSIPMSILINVESTAPTGSCFRCSHLIFFVRPVQFPFQDVKLRHDECSFHLVSNRVIQWRYSEACRPCAKVWILTVNGHEFDIALSIL